MRIAFDGVCFADVPHGGVALAFATGLRAYQQLGGADLLLAVPEGAPLPAGLDLEVVPVPRGAWRRRRALCRLLRARGCDLLHSSVAAVPGSAPCPTIATVHDLPWFASPPVERSRLRARWSTARSLRLATAVLTPSRFTAAHVAAMHPPAAARTHVVPHGIELPSAPADPAALRGPFVVLGDDRPRKNRGRTAAAHALARSRCPDLPPLRFVGAPDAYVDEGQKLALLRQARGLLHLSLFEGFGLPVLEAMAHGVPVLAADAASLPEVCGGAALLADPRDLAAMAAALERLHRDAALRDDLRQRGLQRAHEFAPSLVAQRWRRLHDALRR